MKNLLIGVLLSCIPFSWALAVEGPANNGAITCPEPNAVSMNDNVDGWITLVREEAPHVPLRAGTLLEKFVMEHSVRGHPQALVCEYSSPNNVDVTVKLRRNVNNCHDKVGGWVDDPELSVCLGDGCQITCDHN